MSQEFEDEEDPPESGAPGRQTQIADYVGILVRFRWLILACVGAALVAGMVVSALTRPSYVATVVLAAEASQTTPLDREWRPQSLASFDPEFLPTQTKLMQSREIAERVVRRLHLADNRQLNPRPAVSSASAEQQVSSLARQVQGRIKVEPLRGTNLIELSVVAPSPRLAADIANAAATAYLEWTREGRVQTAGQATEFLKGQIEEVRTELENKQNLLLAYGRQKDVVSSDPRANAPLQNLESLNHDYASAVADRVSKESRYKELQSQSERIVAESISNGLVTQLAAEQARLERDYAEKLNLFKPQWPAMQQLKSQIDRGRDHLDAVVRETVDKARESAKADYQTALRREESLKDVLRSQKSEVLTSNGDTLTYSNLQVEVEAKRALLDSLLKREAETELVGKLSEQGGSSLRIVDRALPPVSRFRPSYRINMSVALLGGGLLGVGLALLLAHLDRSLHTVEDVERFLGLPALGVIPFVGPGSGRRLKAIRSPGNELLAAGQDEETAIELYPNRKPRTLVAERYRAFRTSLLLSRAGGVRTLVVTSTFSREGKTATVLNLAVVLGQLGKRVLVIDADLHRPHVHEVLRMSNRTGLVSVLAENLGPERAIAPTDLPDVWVVTSGPASPNPSGLLASPSMGRLLELAYSQFDFVILDSPPLAAVSDALLVGSLTDGVVLCVRGGKTPREPIQRARDKLLQSNVNVLGVLLNGVPEGREGYGYRYGVEQGYYTEAYGPHDRVSAATRKH